MANRRYQELSEPIKEDGVVRYATTHYPFVPYRDTDIYLIGRARQRLDLLAYEYYNDPQYWWVIAEVNNIGKGTMAVPVNRRIRIPYPLSSIDIQNLINRLNE
jgi:hypothetical protein